MAYLPPLDHAADLPDDKLVNPEPAPVIHHHAPALPEGYIDDDDMEDDEEDPDEDLEEEPIEQVIPEQNNMDGFTLHINPQPAGNINRWLIKDDDEEGSLAGALLASNRKVNAPGPIACNLKSVRRVAARLDKKMFDRYMTEKKIAKKYKEDEFRMNGHEYDITTLDAAVRKNSSEHFEMKKGRIPAELRRKEEPPIYTSSVPRADDPYAMVRDAAMAAQEHEDDDITAPRYP
nr:hypothetical protein [Tanacetum cinerariifolium]